MPSWCEIYGHTRSITSNDVSIFGERKKSFASMKRFFVIALLAGVAFSSVSCRKDGTRCRCVFKSPTAGRQEFIVEEEALLKIAKSCAGYEKYLEMDSDVDFKCYND